MKNRRIQIVEIFFSIIAGICAILASVFGVRNRIRNTRLGANGRVRDDGSRLNDIVHNYKRTKRDKGRVEELDRRDASNIERCNDISSRIRKREQKADISE